MQVDNIIVNECSVCASTENRILFRDYNRRGGLNIYGLYVKCMNCGLVYLKERPSWQNISKYYSIESNDKYANTGLCFNLEEVFNIQKNDLLNPPLWKKIIRLFRKRLHSLPEESVGKLSKSILDVGCGSGQSLVQFYLKGYEVWGIDINKHSIENCKRLVPEFADNFICGELHKVSIPSDYFDYIRIDNCLEHVPNPIECLEKCKSLLKTDGKIYIYVPSSSSINLKIFRKKAINSWIPFHLQLFNRNTFIYIANRITMKVDKIWYIQPLSWLSLTAKNLFPKNKILRKITFLMTFIISWLSYRYRDEIMAVFIKDKK